MSYNIPAALLRASGQNSLRASPPSPPQRTSTSTFPYIHLLRQPQRAHCLRHFSSGKSNPPRKVGTSRPPKAPEQNKKPSSRSVLQRPSLHKPETFTYPPPPGSEPKPKPRSAYVPELRRKFENDSSNPLKGRGFLARSRRWALYGSLGVAAVFGLYLSTLYYSLSRDAEEYAGKEVPADVSDRYTRTSYASTYDEGKDWLERITRVTKLREDLCRLAKGHVLEASVGTGRNAQYYSLLDRKVKSLVMVDKSKEMIYEARRKWPEEGNAWFIWASWLVRDLSRPSDDGIVKCKETTSERFDTAVQTMGLCSCNNGAQLLRNLGDCVDPVNGRILLLEHGRSHYDWMNRFMDKWAPGYADRYGCWFNRDIGRIVRESGLQVLEEKRFSLGTVWWYVLKPNPKPKQQPVVEKVRMVTGSDGAVGAGIGTDGGGWGRWLRSFWS
ncbi:MAG: hypothetical protein M1831_002642 [Alyxoria varia]|nr:MAG: hypothetical protein M1831_002642 [Alyxoria varia]